MNRSKIEPKVTVLKPVATAISIGSGGPFGAEGPIVMAGGGFGSVVGQLMHVSAHERKTLLVAGAAAGMAATFNTPLAAIVTRSSSSSSSGRLGVSSRCQRRRRNGQFRRRRMRHWFICSGSGTARLAGADS